MYSSRDGKVYPTLERSDRIGTHEDTSLPSSSQYQGSNYPPQGGNPRDDYGTHGRQDDRTMGEKAKDTVGMGPHSYGTTGSYDTSRNDQHTSPYSGTISIGDNPNDIDNHSNTSTAGSSDIGRSSNTSSLGSTTTNPSGDSSGLASGSHGTRTINDTYEHHGAGTTTNPSTSATGTHDGITATNDTNNREHKSFVTSMIDKAKHLVGKGHDNDPAHHHQGRDTTHDNDPNKFGTHNNDYGNDRNKHGKHKGHNKHEEANENNLFEPSLTNQ